MIVLILLSNFNIVVITTISLMCLFFHTQPCLCLHYNTLCHFCLFITRYLRVYNSNCRWCIRHTLLCLKKSFKYIII